MRQTMLSILQIFSNKYIYIIAGIIGAYFFGYHNCQTRLQLKHNEEMLEMHANMEKLRNDAKRQSQEITAKYIEQRDNADALYNSNLELIKRLQQQSAPAGSVQTNSSSKCVTDSTTKYRIPERMATRITELARKADQLENYSKRCYEFVKSLDTN